MFFFAFLFGRSPPESFSISSTNDLHVKNAHKFFYGVRSLGKRCLREISFDLRILEHLSLKAGPFSLIRITVLRKKIDIFPVFKRETEFLLTYMKN